MPRWKTAGAIGASIFCAILLILLLARLASSQHAAAQANPWTSRPIKGAFAGVTVREIDAADAAVVLSYDLDNDTGTDFSLTKSLNVVVMSRLKSDNTFSSQRPITLSSSIFVPAGKRGRITLEIAGPFAWPSDSDKTADARVRQLVQGELVDLDGFVLFDQTTHYQVNLPAGWPDFHSATVAHD